MPTGFHLTNARALLFDAAERVLYRDGVSGLTSRAVTAEADVAKGVIHRHFADFDAFLAELILDRVSRLTVTADRLRSATGSGSVIDNLIEPLAAVFSPLTIGELALVVTRDGVRKRLSAAGAPRLPLLAAGTALVGSYLVAEQELGRINQTAESALLAPTIIGAAHLLFTERQPGSPDHDTLRRLIGTVIESAVTENRRRPKRSTSLS